MLLCSCCQSEITAPVWIKGLPFGWRCAEKLTGEKIKQPKKLIDVTKDVVTVICPVNSEQTHFYVRLRLMNPDTKGKIVGSFYCSKIGDSYYVFEGSLKIPKSKNYYQTINGN